MTNTTWSPWLWVHRFLQGLETKIPPPVGKHHTMAAMTCGDPSGTTKEDKLGVTVQLGDREEVFFLSPNDFCKPPTVVVDEIVTILYN